MHSMFFRNIFIDYQTNLENDSKFGYSQNYVFLLRFPARNVVLKDVHGMHVIPIQTKKEVFQNLNGLSNLYCHVSIFRLICL
jgi:hypothetical protein